MEKHALHECPVCGERIGWLGRLLRVIGIDSHDCPNDWFDAFAVSDLPQNIWDAVESDESGKTSLTSGFLDSGNSVKANLPESSASTFLSEPICKGLVFQPVASQSWIFKITTFGQIELNADVTLDRASRAFWEFVESITPQLAAPKLPERLHPQTRELVQKFAAEMGEKLAAAQDKYGYSNDWASPDWMDECRASLIEHLAKGDPRDVANYCAFLWFHGQSTAPAPNPTTDRIETQIEALQESIECLIGELDIPERNCSCFISPPCSDCTDWASARDAIENIHDSLKRIGDLVGVARK